MRKITIYTLCFVFGVIMAAPAWAQQGDDPLSGTWTGDWGPSARDRNDVTVEFAWDGKTLSGMVNPGPNAIPLEKTTFNPRTGAVHLEAVATSPSGYKIRYIVDGFVEKDSMKGSWNHDRIKGDFKITKK